MSITTEQAFNDIRSRFYNEVTVAGSLTAIPVQYGNAKDVTPTGDSVWIQFSVLTGESRQTEFGSRATFYRQSGVAIAQIFSPIGVGEKASLEIADKIIPKFRAVTTPNGVTFRSPSVINVGRSGEYWQINVNMPFFYRSSHQS